MGTGYHGGFGNTAGARYSKPKVEFKKIDYKGTVKVNGIERDVSRRVYQRNDIDYNKIDPKTKLTNLQRMQLGKAPIGDDGKPIQLHHLIQKESGSMVEIRETTHQEYTTTLHGLVGKNESFRNDPVLSKQYANFRTQYWKYRANQITKGKKK